MPALRRSAGRCAGLVGIAIAWALVAGPAPAGAISASVRCEGSGPPSSVLVGWGGPMSGNWDLSWVSRTTGATGSWSVPSNPVSLSAGSIGPLTPGETYVFTVVGRPPTESEAESTGPVSVACMEVDAGPDLSRSLRDAFTLDGSATGVDPGSVPQFAWQKDSGPGVVVFDEPRSEDTRVRFSEPGRYVLRLTATLGARVVSDQVTVEAERTPLAWGEVYSSALRQYQDNRKTGARGYYQQVLNLVCAASLAQTKACKPMRPYYAAQAWAGDWVHSMFRSFLLPYRPTSVARKLAVDGASVALALLVVKRFPFAIAVLDPRNVAAGLVGAAHFVYDLRPGFKTQTRIHIAQVRELLGPAAGAGDVAVAAAIRAGVLRCQHDALFGSAVVPGFRVVTASGGLSSLGGAFASGLVPWAAKWWRERYVEAGLRKLLGRDRGKAMFAESRSRGCPPPA